MPVIPMQSYADRGDSDNKKDKDLDSKTSANYESDKKSTNQDMDQDNFCYRGDDECQQANEGEQIVGKDNDAKGFKDQSKNIQQQSVTVTPPVTPPVTPIFTCDNCYAGLFLQLNRGKEFALRSALDVDGNPFTPPFCDIEFIRESVLRAQLAIGGPISLMSGGTFPGLTTAELDALVQCLMNAGLKVVL